MRRTKYIPKTVKGKVHGTGWDADPWEWVIEFERCEKPGEEICRI